MEIRNITNEERAEILRGMDYAYAEWSERDIEAAQLQAVTVEDTWAAVIDGKIASILINHDFWQVVRGALKGMGGIGGVWTYPEYRNRGLVKALIRNAFTTMQQRQASVSMLIPFKETFYSAFGYITANASLDIKAPLRALIDALEHNTDATWQCERVPASQVKSDFFDFWLEVSVKQHHGMTLPIAMTDHKWMLQTAKELCVFVRQNDALVALAIYSINADGFKPMSDRTLSVRHMGWKSLEARAKLFGFFASHRDQVGYIAMDLPLGTNFFQWFRNINDPYDLQLVNSHFRRTPFMVRVVDVVGAIAHLPAPLDGCVTMAVTDPDCDWNNGHFTVQAQAGKLAVQRHTLADDLGATPQPDLQASIQGVTALVYGTLPLEEIEYRQWLKVLNPDVRTAIAHWFPVLPLYSTFRF